MNRPLITVSAAQPAVKVDQATAIHGTKTLPIMNPRRSVSPAGAGIAALLAGLGRTVCGLGGAAFPGAAALAGAAAAALAASSLAFLAPAWRRASARSRGSEIFSSGGSVRAAPAFAAGAAAVPALAAAGLPVAAGAA